jgi:glycosyltransferase involved in cell wall biosynthesis
MNDYKIRIIVPCYNSDLTIEKCISSIFDSEGIEFELFVVDDGNNNKLASIKNNYPINIIKTSGHEGAGKARNIGTFGFNGQVVIFIDSDVQIHPDTLAFLTKPIKENLAEATVGSYLKVPGKNFYDAYKHFYLAYRYNNQGKYLSNTFWSAICALDYHVFVKIKGFKECFSGAGPEDIDIGVELSLQWARILSVPQARGVHLSSYGFIKLLRNDLRKGSEDIYIHWTRKVPIMHNRHVNKADIFAVFLACCIPLLFLFQYYIGIIPLLTCILLYFIVRIRFIKNAFGGEDFLFLFRSFLLTCILDVIRGCGVIKGTLLFILEILSSGKYKPFTKLTY